MRKSVIALLVLGIAAVVAQGKWELTILHMNDTHSHLEGMARQATLVEGIRAEADPVLLFHAGDAFVGTLYFTVHEGAANAWVMNAMDFSAMALGNHEFDKGPEGLSSFAEAVDFPLLCANFDFSEEPALAGKILPYTIINVGEEQIGVIGLTTEDTAWSSSPGPNIVIGDAFARAEEAVAELTAQGIDKIVVLSHLGWDEDLVLAQKVAGIDLVVGGHSHTLPAEYPTVAERPLVNINTASAEELEALPGIGPVIAQRIVDYRTEHGPFQMIEEIEGVSGIGPARFAQIKGLISVEDVTIPTLVVQAGENAQYLGRLEVTFDDGGIVTNFGGELLAVTDEIPMRTDIAEGLLAFQEPIEALKALVVGETLVDLDGERANVRTRETNLGNLIADAMLWKAQVAQGKIAIQNGGGIRASIPTGPITLGQAMEVLPFGNYLMVLELTGAQIVAALENGVSMVEQVAGRFPQVGGLRFTWDPGAPVGERIVLVEVRTPEGYEPIDPAATYRVVTNNFLATGGDGYTVFLEAAEVINLGFVDYEVLAEYLQAHSPVSPKEEGRIIVP
jgi:5'-nucleotidase